LSLSQCWLELEESLEIRPLGYDDAWNHHTLFPYVSSTSSPLLTHP
jgi:hypothetical protein